MTPSAAAACAAAPAPPFAPPPRCNGAGGGCAKSMSALTRRSGSAANSASASSVSPSAARQRRACASGKPRPSASSSSPSMTVRGGGAAWHRRALRTVPSLALRGFAARSRALASYTRCRSVTWYSTVGLIVQRGAMFKALRLCQEKRASCSRSCHFRAPPSSALPLSPCKQAPWALSASCCCCARRCWPRPPARLRARARARPVTPPRRAVRAISATALQAPAPTACARSAERRQSTARVAVNASLGPRSVLRDARTLALDALVVKALATQLTRLESRQARLHKLKRRRGCS